MKRAASLTLLISLTALNLDARELTSPDGKIVVAFDVTRGGGLGYRVAYRGQPILCESRLGLEAKNTSAFAEGFRVVNVATESHDETWRPVYGERSHIRDHYNQMAVDLEDEQKPPRRLKLTFRAYDEGVAFRYTIPQQPGLDKIHLTRENSEFIFARLADKKK
ncbi:hypothetical protein LCGC14_3154710 [marine sediment metagenome]|uniref:Glycosyl-hydrolase 97 N-terminal domain-containing protein n=1 Tax=marine sediment metagenome TaxID=412755 RepID=A0A0F8WH41_9ZZZZ